MVHRRPERGCTRASKHVWERTCARQPRMGASLRWLVAHKCAPTKGWCSHQCLACERLERTCIVRFESVACDSKSHRPPALAIYACTHRIPARTCMQGPGTGIGRPRRYVVTTSPWDSTPIPVAHDFVSACMPSIMQRARVAADLSRPSERHAGMRVVCFALIGLHRMVTFDAGGARDQFWPIKPFSAEASMASNRSSGVLPGGMVPSNGASRPSSSRVAKPCAMAQPPVRWPSCATENS